MDAPEQGSAWELSVRLGEGSGMTETARKNRQVLIDAYDAQLRGDLDAWWGMLHPEVTFHEASSLPFGCDYTGIEGAKRGVDGMFGAWSRVKVVFEEFLAAGDLVIAYLRMTATARNTGKVYDGFGTEVFRFRDGKVIEWRPFYWDTHLVRQVTGAE